MKGYIRNLMSRSIAITPSLIVSIIGGSYGTGRLIIIASIIIISWILGLGLIGINLYYLIEGFVGWLIHSSLPKVAIVFIGIIVFPLMAIYIASVIHLAFRKDTVETSVEAKNDLVVQTHQERGLTNPNDQLELSHAPYREDLANIQLPK